MHHKSCLIIGGEGYIGRKLAENWSETGRFSRIILADLKSNGSPLPNGAEFVTCDVRQDLAAQLGILDVDWIVNLAAIHREPGHAREEYFETNVKGARNVCAYAELTGCKNIFFTSSIAPYGPTSGPTTEQTPCYPTTPYGISKFAAELIQEGWQKSDAVRRLVICRPGVVYGPGDPGNILRMIKAVKSGYFILPGSPAIKKSYAYVYGLVESINFMMDRSDNYLCFNYVEKETEPLGRLVELINQFLKKKSPLFHIPIFPLTVLARGIQIITRGKSSIHPVRVRKAATPTHIVPETLMRLGFPFRYDFLASLADWKNRKPDDF